MTLEERAKEFVSKIASGTSQEMDYYANLLVEFVNETTEYLKIELATSEHDREHNDYELVEVYKKVEQLEKENAELKENYEKRGKTIISLEKQLRLYIKSDSKLAKAKEIIKEILDTPQGWQSGCEWCENEDYDKVISKAEQFLKETK